MTRETWYVLETGEVADPRQIKVGADGKLCHKDGRKVAYAPHGPRSRSVNVDEVKDMRPKPSGRGYVTRDVQHPLDHDGNGKPGGSSKPDDAGEDIAALRAEYHTALGKRPFAGWDAATLREKIAEQAKAGDETA
jgi:hypothetical protein